MTSAAPGDDRTRDPEHADQRECRCERVPRAEALREEGSRRREQAHTQDGDRPEQAGNGVRHVEIELDRRDQRADADQLRTQRQRREEERGEKCPAPQSTTVS